LFVGYELWFVLLIYFILFFKFCFWVVLLFVGYEFWFVSLHVLMVFKLGFGDETWLSLFLMLCNGDASMLLQGRWSG
jgi:hypothetical protein